MDPIQASCMLILSSALTFPMLFAVASNFPAGTQRVFYICNTRCEDGHSDSRSFAFCLLTFHQSKCTSESRTLPPW